MCILQKKLLLRYFIRISFLGKEYCGWQIQPGQISVQETIEKCIGNIIKEKINIVGAGRTDSGVHATSMYAHFDTENFIQNKDFLRKINLYLPNDISILDLFRVKEKSHARFDATSRTYKYFITKNKDPFKIYQSFLCKYELDLKLMNKAAKTLLKFDDFESFSKSKTDVKTFICKVNYAQFVEEKETIIFEINANRFLRNMVRAIVGTLIEVGRKKISLKEFEEIILKKNRSSAGFSAPAKGLFLSDIIYDWDKIK